MQIAEVGVAVLTSKAKEVVQRLANNVIRLIESHRDRDDDRALWVHSVTVGNRSEVNTINANACERNGIQRSGRVARVLWRIVQKQPNRTQADIEIFVWELLCSQLVNALYVIKMGQNRFVPTVPTPQPPVLYHVRDRR